MADTTLRPVTLDDAAAVVALVNAEGSRLTGSNDSDLDVAEVGAWWTQPPPFELTRDVCVAVRDGTIVGYGDLAPEADGAVMWLDVRGETDAVLPELERRALRRVAAGGVLRASAYAADTGRARVLEDRGYTAIRASYRMEIDLEGRTFSPALPHGTTIRAAHGETDDELLHALVERTFADHWGFETRSFEEWRHWLRNAGEVDPTLWFVAEAEGDAVGVALCRPTMHGNSGLGWVSELGVVTSARRKGLGMALLLHAFAEFQRRGYARVGLGVDAENTTGAVALYERAGMRVVRRSDTWEKPA